jgi:hypothetical protein
VIDIVPLHQQISIVVCSGELQNPTVYTAEQLKKRWDKERK